MNYFNNIKDRRIQYILNLSQTSPTTNLRIMFNSEVERNIQVSSEISIIHSYAQEALFTKQCSNNNIPTLVLHSNDILKTLRSVKTPYCLIALGNDSVIVNNLTDDFIETFKSLDIPVCFCGSLVPQYRLPIETAITVTIPGISKYINPSLVFGYTQELIRFYELVTNVFGTSTPGTDQSQRLLLYYTLVRHFGNALSKVIDSQQKLFSTVSPDTYDLFELNENTRIVSRYIQVPFSEFLF